MRWIPAGEWAAYVKRLAAINDKAAEEMKRYITAHGYEDADALIDYAYGLATKYGEASAALSAEMYDAIASLEKANVPAAVPAETASYQTVSKTVHGVAKQSQNENMMANAVARLVKQAGADTTLQNALRDGAEFAWVPAGDTCAFCITLASRGWQRASKKAIRNGHAEHIHSNCDCTYAIRFNGETNVRGYDPDRYLEQYEAADGTSPKDRINAMRRQFYAENADEINSQKRAAYAKQMSLSQSAESAEKSTELTDRRRRRAAEWRERHTSHVSHDLSQMDASKLREYAENSLKTSFVGMNGANTDFVREAVKVMDKFEEKMGGKTIDGLKVQFGGLPKGVYAKYDDKTNTILLKKSGSIAQFEESQKAENARYRIRWGTDQDYHATETYSGTIWHELGHAIDISEGQSLSRRLSATSALDQASVRVSAYAGTTQNIRVTKRSEAWAENFSAYMDGGKNGKRVPQEIVKMIEAYFERYKGKTH